MTEGEKEENRAEWMTERHTHREAEKERQIQRYGGRSREREEETDADTEADRDRDRLMTSAIWWQKTDKILAADEFVLAAVALCAFLDWKIYQMKFDGMPTQILLT